METRINCRPWRSSAPPHKILVSRYQALGDLVVTLPYLNFLKNRYKDIIFHLITRREYSALPLTLPLFEKVITIGGGRNTKLQFISTLLTLPYLFFQGYDMVLDLQNNSITRIIRRVLRPKAWSEFDRFSELSAGERTKRTIQAIGFDDLHIDTSIHQKIDEGRLKQKLISAGWNGINRLVILNPAGAFTTRNWPLQNFVRLVEIWKSHDDNLQFVITGLKERIGDKVRYLKQQLGNKLIDVTDTTDAAEAFALPRVAEVVITEDGGLMHMSWVQGVPTLAIFGSSNSTWSRPLGDWSMLFDSSDLPCGNCLLADCKYGDVHCLTRYTPEFILQKALLIQGKTNAVS